MKNEIKVGTKLIAIVERKTAPYALPALTIGNEYKVACLNGVYFTVTNDAGNPHSFPIQKADKYFKLAEPSEPTYTLTAEQLKETAEDGAKVKEMFPEVFEAKLEIGKWYKSNHYGHDYLMLFSGSDQSYGFFLNSYGLWSFSENSAQKGAVPATDEEVTTALEKECVTRYGEDWKNAKIAAPVRGDHYKVNSGEFDLEITPRCIWNRNGCIFNNGKWAEPLSDITTVSLDKAKKILAKRYNTTPDKIEIK